MKKIIIFIALASFFACTKDADETNNDNLTQTNIENWFNKKFKNSKEWKENTESPNKIPAWSKGAYLKKDSVEVFEFPLEENYAKITIPKDKSITAKEVNKVINATLHRLVIIKTDTNMIVRKLYYVPTYKYLQSKGGDISNVMLGKENDDFTGLLITKNWNDAILSYYNVKNGEIDGMLVKKEANSKIASKAINELDEVIVMNHYQQRNSIFITPPPPCYYLPPITPIDPYKTSGGGGSYYIGNSDDGSRINKTECINALDKIVESSYPTSQLISSTIISETNSDIMKNYKWKFFSGPGYGLYSSDTGTLKKVSNSDPKLRCEFTGLVHNSIYKEGVSVATEISYTTIYAHPTVGKYSAIMDLNYNVKFTPIGISCAMSTERNYSANKIFAIND